MLLAVVQETGMLKDEICNLAANVQTEEIRITVRGNHLWSDFTVAELAVITTLP